MTRVSGFAFASSNSSGSCGKNSHASYDSPSGASCATPARYAGSSSSPRGTADSGLASVGSVSHRQVTHPAEAPATGFEMRFEHLAHAFAEAQVRVADDAFRDRHRAVLQRLGHARDVGRLAHRFQFGQPESR